MPSYDGFIPASADEDMRTRVKVELRKRMRALRKTLPASACAQRSDRIVERLAAFEPVTGARSVCLFWPIEERHEIDLRPLDVRLRARGARIAYPGIDPETHVMSFRFVDDATSMRDQGFAFYEPPASCPEATPSQLDVIIVPALAVDPRGHRIGYGAGYYDRTLPIFLPTATTIAVAFDFQLIAETPNSAVDVPVAWVVTDQRAFGTNPEPDRERRRA